jgi:hypothetical protein
LFGLNFVSLPLWEGERTPKDAEFIQSHILRDISSLNYYIELLVWKEIITSSSPDPVLL